MKRLLASIVLAAQLAAPAIAAGLSARDVDAVHAAIASSSAAFARGDVDAVIDSTADQLVAAMGGREKYAVAIRGTVKTMHDLDLHVDSHTMEAPSAPVTANGYLLTVVKESTVMSAHGHRGRTDGFTIAVRPVAGGAWKLIGGKGVSRAPQVMQQLFPAIPANYAFPPFDDQAE